MLRAVYRASQSSTPATGQHMCFVKCVAKNAYVVGEYAGPTARRLPNTASKCSQNGAMAFRSCPQRLHGAQDAPSRHSYCDVMAHHRSCTCWAWACLLHQGSHSSSSIVAKFDIDLIKQLRLWHLWTGQPDPIAFDFLQALYCQKDCDQAMGHTAPDSIGDCSRHMMVA